VVAGGRRMKPETYLNAYQIALLQKGFTRTINSGKLDRQINAFRARILRMFEEQKRQLEEWETYHGFYIGDLEFIETMHDKDVQIEKLTKENKALGIKYETRHSLQDGD
jgi:hypothetical protein